VSDDLWWMEQWLGGLIRQMVDDGQQSKVN
jgi:hypothetical protein